MAEQGGPNLTGKKGHFETNKVEGDRDGVLGAPSATAVGGGSPELAGTHYERGTDVRAGPSMVANVERSGRRRRPRGIDPSLHTDTSLRPVRAQQRAERRSFTPDLDDDGDPYLGPRGDPAEGARDFAPGGHSGGDPYLGARGDPAEGRRDD